MPVFQDYAKYYDLLYQDKDYQAEVVYVHDLIQKYAPGAKTILDLGCGTGRHDILLAEKGYEVTGVDLSEQMVEIARSRVVASTFNPQPSTPSFSVGDIRSLRLNKTFDVVVALFHVMSYQTNNSDVLSALKTAVAHMKQRSVLIFDCWYGPGVLSEKPERRRKRVEIGTSTVIRFADPVIHANQNVVDVNYHVVSFNASERSVEETKEVHKVRYFFRPELDLCLDVSGLTMLNFEEFMTGSPPGATTWNACFVAKIKLSGQGQRE